MFAGLGGTSYTLEFIPKDGITDSMLKFDKVKTLPISSITLKHTKIEEALTADTSSTI